MAIIYPNIENIKRLKVKPTEGEWHLIKFLESNLDDSYEVFYTPYLDGDRPDIIIIKEHCAAFIIEIKDWSLSNYEIIKGNKWLCTSKYSSTVIKSPHAQALSYKSNIYNLHCPELGLAELKNKNYYKVIDCFVYFHKSTKNQISNMYDAAESIHQKKINLLNKQIKEKEIAFDKYDREVEYNERILKKLRRDKGMSMCEDSLQHLKAKICAKRESILFDDSIYRDLKRRLSPPVHTQRQGLPIPLDPKQLSLTDSSAQHGKVKGVAGCGKTIILSQRAVNASNRTESTVLILTFNITLKNYIRDKISDIQNCRDYTKFEISNYHQFFKSQANNSSINLSEIMKTKNLSLEDAFAFDIFKDQEVNKYKTVLIDEVQDYDSRWIKIIRDNFLENDGEMILFGDDSQDIYQRESTRSPVIAQGFGRWRTLNKSYRTNSTSPLNQIFRDFQINYILQKNSNIDIADFEPTQISMGFGLIKYKCVAPEDFCSAAFEEIEGFIKAYDLHPNDTVVLASKSKYIRSLNEKWSHIEKSQSMIETYEELAVALKCPISDLYKLSEADLSAEIENKFLEVEKIRRRKKAHFYPNPGVIKFSTVHSYKGFESQTIFYIMDEDDSPELVYTALTRAAENLIVLDVGGHGNFSSFLKSAAN